MNYALAASMTASEALCRILLRLLDEMQDKASGVCRREDPEFLHDFRVAVRRTRSALSQVKNVLPPAKMVFFRQEFAWLGALTGAARDLDVYLLHFPEFQQQLPSAVREDLLPFRRFLERHQSIEYNKVIKHLESDRVKQLVIGWRQYLEQSAEAGSQLRGSEPVGAVARPCIWKAYRRVLRQGRSITEESPAADLHELRKSCKKLRYLMEFFRALYPLDKIDRLIKELKSLQDHLGTYQDLHVQVETLYRFSLEMAAEGAAPTETLLALGRLVEGFDRRQVVVREEFAKRFLRFSAEKNQQLFRELFKAKG